MALNFCPKCGARIDDDLEICACGHDLTKDRKKRVNEKLSEIKEEEQEKSKTMIRPGGEIIKAGFFQRFGAFIIDLIIIGLIMIFLTILLPPLRNSLQRTMQRRLIGRIIFPSLNDLVFWIVAFLYFWLLESFNEGRSIGKMLLKLRTVDEKTHEPTTKGKYAINNLLKSNRSLFFIDFLIGILYNIGKEEKRLRIMQNASKTVVLKEKR
ncbi:MAG: hypothetical protein EU548_07955 [Promethearchaeota archaeon]|nr:MAG: hypothetical protein EU548_07955 [Candidatus Lokiarchaeota archaeon]